MNIELDLITACINRERRAEYELYKLTYSYLMSICIRYTNNKEEAEEILNTGFLKILNNLTKYRTEIPFKVWMRKVMINVLIDSYRKEKTRNEQIKYVENYIETSDFADVNNALVKMNTEQIYRLIKQLPPMSQKVFNLYAIDGFAHKEIAEMLDMSEGTSKWHLSFSRQQLKEMIAKMVSSKTTVS
ncbi:MAG TPA: RNA polymerase sigma factor [Bacteroidia bacterium]|nr:RNA polymerase sigma factor [Bacteroidia bacterium]